MGQAYWWVIDIVSPAILLIVLILLVLRTGSGPGSRTEAGTRELYRDEEERRLEGTDEL